VKFWDPAEGETGPQHLKRDKSMADRLRDESEGILSWLVKGCLNWRAEGLGTARAVSRATAEYRSESDVVGRFLTDRCIVGDGLRESVKALDEAFEHWAAANGEYRLSWRKVGSELKRKRFVSYSNNGTWYRGIMLRPVAEVTE
jgi:putative DNA primase/helicase